MTAGVDHLVIAAGDWQGLCRSYDALGFTLTPPARHPFGTGNRLAQLAGSFLELLGVFDETRITAGGPGRFSFAEFNRRFLDEHGDGLSMLVLSSRDAGADVERFAAAGLDTYPPFDFSRTARLPDGEEVTVGFSLAFVTHRDFPHAAFFTCQQHAPEHFWKPAYQTHANSAKGIAEVWLTSAAAAEHGAFMARFAGAPAVQDEAGGWRIATAHGDIVVADEAGFEARFAAPPAAFAGAGGLSGFVVEVADMDRFAQAVETSGIELRRAGDLMVVDVGGVSVGFVAGKNEQSHERS